MTLEPGPHRLGQCQGQKNAQWSDISSTYSTVGGTTAVIIGAPAITSVLLLLGAHGGLLGTSNDGEGGYISKCDLKVDRKNGFSLQSSLDAS